MLDVASADARLVAADPAVPGLRDVLHPLGLVQRLAPGWEVADARAGYLRYKPGTSLVAGLLLTDADGATSFAQALALGPGAPDKLAKLLRAGEADDVGRGVRVDDRLGVALVDVTADRRLPGVRRVLRQCDHVTPLVYKPARRWVARTERAGRPSSLVKVYHPAELPEFLTGYRALAGLPVPTAGRVHRRFGIVTTPWLPGTALDGLTGPGVAQLWSLAGSVLAQVHRQPRIDGLQQVDQVAALAAAVAAVHAVAPEHAAAARAAAEQVRAGLCGTQIACVTHGDFSADQVIVRPDVAESPTGTTAGSAPVAPGSATVGSAPVPADAAHAGRAPTPPGAAPSPARTEAPAQAEVTVVDLDRVGLGDPLADLASWYGALVAAGARQGDPLEVLAPLLAGYAAAGGHAEFGRLRLHCAAAVLQRAAEPFRRHLPDWPAQVARLVSVARELAA